jgi:hypothetical protein
LCRRIFFPNYVNAVTVQPSLWRERISEGGPP